MVFYKFLLIYSAINLIKIRTVKIILKKTRVKIKIFKIKKFKKIVSLLSIKIVLETFLLG